jgi:hypothetical protein
VTFTATVTPGTGTFDNLGTVQFAVDGTNYGAPQNLNGGIASIPDSALTVGPHTITATYSGDTSYNGSSGTLSGGQTVVRAGSLAACNSRWTGRTTVRRRTSAAARPASRIRR